MEQFPYLIVSSELPVARYSPLLAAHLMQPACSFSANFGLSLYCSKKPESVRLLTKKNLGQISQVHKLPHAHLLQSGRQNQPGLVRMYQQ